MCVALDNPLVVGDVGSLQSVLEDYLEVDRYQVCVLSRNCFAQKALRIPTIIYIHLLRVLSCYLLLWFCGSW